MKQTITQNQWDELTHEQHKELWSGMERSSRKFPVELPNIGQIIEFLGKDLYHMDRYDKWHVQSAYIPNEEQEELVDALWSTCKLKLKS